MKVLIPITIFCFAMAYLSEMNSVVEINEVGVKQYIKKDKIVFFLMAIGMAVFVGLRISGNDTYAYRGTFESLDTGFNEISKIDFSNISAAPGLTFVSIVLKTIGATSQDYFMIFALFTVITYLWFIRKYSSDIFMSVYLFVTMGVYTFTMAAIKQTTAVAFLVIATDRAINKKWLQFIIFVLIAELFHPYAFIYLIIPFLFFKPWSNRTYVFLLGTVLVALLLENLMSGILSMTDSLGYNYNTNEFVGEGVNIFRVLVVWSPIVLSLFVKRELQNNTDRVAQLVINASMINAMIMFIALFGTANYFARLANYFLIFQTLALPYILNLFDKQSKSQLKTVCVILYFAYYYYGSAIANGGFDVAYSFMSISDYIKQLF